MLHGAEAILGHQHGAGAGIGGKILGCAQVQNLNASVMTHHEIIRADIPVDNAQIMHLGQGFNGREENAPGLIPAQSAVLIHQRLQRSSLRKVHDNVSGIVLGEHLADMDNTADTGNLCHFSRFPDGGSNAIIPKRRRLLIVIPLHR